MKRTGLHVKLSSVRPFECPTAPGALAATGMTTKEAVRRLRAFDPKLRYELGPPSTPQRRAAARAELGRLRAELAGLEHRATAAMQRANGYAVKIYRKATPTSWMVPMAAADSWEHALAHLEARHADARLEPERTSRVPDPECCQGCGKRGKKVQSWRIVGGYARQRECAWGCTMLKGERHVPRRWTTWESRMDSTAAIHRALADDEREAAGPDRPRA